MNIVTLGLFFLGGYLLLRKKPAAKIPSTLGVYPELQMDASNATMIGRSDYGRSRFTTTITLQWKNLRSGDTIIIAHGNKMLEVLQPTPGGGSETLTITFDAYAGTDVRLVAYVKNVIGEEFIRATTEAIVSTGVNDGVWV